MKLPNDLSKILGTKSHAGEASGTLADAVAGKKIKITNKILLSRQALIGNRLFRTSSISQPGYIDLDI